MTITTSHMPADEATELLDALANNSPHRIRQALNARSPHREWDEALDLYYKLVRRDEVRRGVPEQPPKVVSDDELIAEAKSMVGHWEHFQTDDDRARSGVDLDELLTACIAVLWLNRRDAIAKATADD